MHGDANTWIYIYIYVEFVHIFRFIELFSPWAYG